MPSPSQLEHASKTSLLLQDGTAMSNPLPLVAPVFPAGKEPLPPGWTEVDRDNMLQAKKYQQWMQVGMESCAAKTVIAGAGGAS